MEKITNEICRLKVPFETTYTSVFYVKTQKGLLIFDAATYDRDVTECIIPGIYELGYDISDVEYIFISHNHDDHSGGLKKLSEILKGAKLIAKDEALEKKHPDFSFVNPKDGFEITKDLVVITIPGHTFDSIALFDKREKTLITGDCLQLYGIYGSGVWGANITYVKEYFEALNKLKKMDISRVCTSHDYHPMGNEYKGKEEIFKAYSTCVKALFEIKELIDENKELEDKEIADIYRKSKLPPVGAWVVKALRDYNGEF